VLTVGLVTVFPRSILLFLLFQGSLLYAYVARIPNWLRAGILGVGLLVLMPVIGAYYNGYYLEVATQVGIFAALALGLNIVVGLAGLLDLGYVAFFAVGAYSWAIVGSPHANLIFGSGFPLAPGWFYVFLFVGLAVAAITGALLGLPVLRLHGDYLAIVTLGFGEVIRVLANNLDKPINLTNGPKGITPIGRPPVPFGMSYAEAFYFLVLLIVGVVILVNRRLEEVHNVRLQSDQNGLSLRIPKAGIELQHHRQLRAVRLWNHHHAAEENASKGSSRFRHFVHDALRHMLQQPVAYLGAQQAITGVCTHAPGIGAGVSFTHAFVVLGSCERHSGSAVTECEKRDLFALKKLLQHQRRFRGSQQRTREHLLGCVLGLRV